MALSEFSLARALAPRRARGPLSPGALALRKAARRRRFDGCAAPILSYLPDDLGCDDPRFAGIPVLLPVMRDCVGFVVFADPVRPGVVEVSGVRATLTRALKSAGFTVSDPRRRLPALQPVELDRVAFLRDGTHVSRECPRPFPVVSLSPGVCPSRGSESRRGGRWAAPRPVSDSQAFPRRWTEARRAVLRAWMLREFARPELVAARLQRAREAQRRLLRLRDPALPRLTGPRGGGIKRRTPECIKAWRRAWRQKRRAEGKRYA